MKIEMDITATLTAEDINKIITEHLEREGYEVLEITPKIDTRSVGHQMNEYQETVFGGVTAKIVKKRTKSYDQRDR